MRTISFAGFSVIVTAYVKDEYGGDVLLLSFAASTRTHAKAIWAALSNANNRVQACTAIRLRTDGRSGAVRLARNTKYRTQSRSFCGECRHALGGGKVPFNCPSCKAKLRGRPLTTQYTLIHPDLLVVNDKSRQPFFLIEKGEGVPATFYQRLKIALPIPTRSEWAEWLWEEGQKKVRFPYKDDKRCALTRHITPIRPVVAAGVRCWSVNPDQWAWLEIVRQKLGLVVRLKKQGDHVKTSWEGEGWEIRREHGGWCSVYKGGKLCEFQGKDAEEDQPKMYEMKAANLESVLALVAVHHHIRLVTEGAE